MANVLIRDVADEDLQEIRTAAASNGSSLQRYLHDAIRAQAAYLRRQDAIARAADRLTGTAPVDEAERSAVLAAIDAAHDERAGELGLR